MPVVSAEREWAVRGGDRRWLWLLVVPLLLLMLLFVPLVHPVVLQVGDRWLVLEFELSSRFGGRPYPSLSG